MAGLRLDDTPAEARLRERVRRFCHEQLPVFVPREYEHETPVELVAALGRAGLVRHVVPRAHGGASSRVSSSAVALVREELARALPLADTMYAMQGLGSYPLTLAANERIKRQLLPEVARGRLITGFAITEEQAGSDAGGIATRAVRDGRHYVLEGSKRYISNAGVAGHYVVFARTDDDAISAFAVEADTPGLELVEQTETLAAHPLGVLRFDGCRVPAARRLGPEGSGLKLALRTLEVFRPTVGAAACGMAERALSESLAHVERRQQFGRPLKAFQALRFKLARMALELEAARLLVRKATRLVDAGRPDAMASAMAKLAATESAQRVVDEAVQIHGGAGVVRGHPVERLYREVRALRIYEGTSEIQHLVIARELLGR